MTPYGEMGIYCWRRVVDDVRTKIWRMADVFIPEVVRRLAS